MAVLVHNVSRRFGERRELLVKDEAGVELHVPGAHFQVYAPAAASGL